MEPLTKVLVIGADSADPELIDLWGAAGDLPNLMTLRARAARGVVKNPYAIESSSVWPTFHTGLLPGHQPNFDGPTVYNPATYDFELPPPADVPPPIWIRLSRAGKRCAVIDPPYVQLDSTINGLSVVDWSPHVPADGTEFATFRTYPENLAEEVLDIVGPDPADGFSCEHRRFWTVEDYKDFIAETLLRIEKRARLTRHMFAKGHWDYFQVVFMELHCAGHHLWHLNDESHPSFDPKLKAVLGNPLRDCYKAVDAAIGKILADVDDTRTAVIFFASHGMGPLRTATGILDRALLRIEGMADTNMREHFRRTFRPLWRSLPIRLREALLPAKMRALPAERSASLAGSRQHRKFFEILAHNGTGAVRLNVAGRDPKGVVAPEDYNRVVDGIMRALRTFINVETGEPLVEDIVRTTDRYAGEFVSRMPDLLVTWNRSAPIRVVRSPLYGTIRQDFYTNRTGDHRPEGLFYAAGPGIISQTINQAVSPADFLPTIQALLGVPKAVFASGAGGRPILAIYPATRAAS